MTGTENVQSVFRNWYTLMFSTSCTFQWLCRSPALATHEVPELGNEGVMAVVSELASGVAGLAKTIAKGRPNGYRAGSVPLFWDQAMSLSSLSQFPDSFKSDEGICCEYILCHCDQAPWIFQMLLD